MSIEKSILQSIAGKTITESKLNDNNLLTLTFKDGGKIVLLVNMAKGVDYISPKIKPNVKLERVKRFAEKALVEPASISQPKKRKHKKKEPANE